MTSAQILYESNGNVSDLSSSKRLLVVSAGFSSSTGEHIVLKC